MNQTPMIYRGINTEAELRELWKFDCLAYGEAGLPWDNFLLWWSAFPDGLHGAFAGDMIVGAVGMWPFKSASYDTMLRGTLPESDITIADFDLDSEIKPKWYISGIVLREDWRRTGPIGALVFTAIERLGSLAHVEHIDVCAVGSTNEGRRMLDRFGFQINGTTTYEGFPIYTSSNLPLDLALGETSIPSSSEHFRYRTNLRKGSYRVTDPDDLRYT